jgi:hypothetical protein
MEKKRYERPIVLDLNGNTASGDPLSSTGQDTACSGGNGVATGDCMVGTSPGTGWCEGRSTGARTYKPTCTSGPSG